MSNTISQFEFTCSPERARFQNVEFTKEDIFDTHLKGKQTTLTAKSAFFVWFKKESLNVKVNSFPINEKLFNSSLIFDNKKRDLLRSVQFLLEKNDYNNGSSSNSNNKK